MSESTLWQRVRGGLSPFGDLQRIETGAIAAGVPDVNYCFDGKEGWLELKYGVWPKREATLVFASQRGLTAEQVEWLMFRAKCGGRCFVLFQLEKELVLVHGRHAAAMRLCTRPLLYSHAQWRHVGGMKEEDWQGLKKCLTEK